MELKKYLQIAKENALFLIAIILIGALSAYFTAPHINSGYRAQSIFYLTNQAQEASASQSYNFGGYFLQSTAINATDTAIAILESANFQSQLKNSGAATTIKKVAPQVIEITVISKDPDVPKSQIESIPGVFNAKMKELNSVGSALTLSPISNQINVSYYSLNSKVVALAGLVIGAVFAFLILGLKTYLEF